MRQINAAGIRLRKPLLMRRQDTRIEGMAEYQQAKIDFYNFLTMPGMELNS
jgi:hypothetical protein